MLTHRRGLRLESPGVLRRYFRTGQQVVNASALDLELKSLLRKGCCSAQNEAQSYIFRAILNSDL